MTSSEFHAGDWVEIRSKEEILRTLDRRAQLEHLPFMPEMFRFCGQRFRVFKRAHKTCDPPSGLAGRRMSSAVHLEGLRCDGAAHGGCQHACLIFWKDAWLRPASPSDLPSASREPSGTAAIPRESGCTEVDVFASTLAVGATVDDPQYVCQNTQVPLATEPLHWWDFRQYWEDYNSGNVNFAQLLAALSFFVFHKLATGGLGIGAAVRWVYDSIQKQRRGTPYPWRVGRVARGLRTPAVTLNLQPGELVKVKSYDEILNTLDEDGNNRGMWFDAEMVPYCGGTYRVLDRVSRIINEKTGRMLTLKNECIILENVVCNACYAKQRKFCPRSIYPYWREIWLERP